MCEEHYPIPQLILSCSPNFILYVPTCIITRQLIFPACYPPIPLQYITATMEHVTTSITLM